MEKGNKLPVSPRALLARINRKLAQQQHQMKRARAGTRLHQGVGDYYVLDVYRNAVVDMQCSLEVYAKDLQVLAPHECVGED